MVKTIYTIIIAGLLILAFIISLKVLKSVVRATMSVVMLAVVGLAVFGVVLYADFTDFQEAMQGNVTFVLEEEGEFLAGVKVQDFQDDNASSYTQEEVEAELETDDLVVFMDYDYIKTNESITVPGLEAEIGDELIDILRTNEGEEAVDIISEANDMSEIEELALSTTIEETGLEQMKAMLVIAMISNIEGESLAQVLFEGVRDGKVEFQPEFRSVKMIEYIPYSVGDDTNGDT